MSPGTFLVVFLRGSEFEKLLHFNQIKKAPEGSISRTREGGATEKGALDSPNTGYGKPDHVNAILQTYTFSRIQHTYMYIRATAN